jgi:hypothetical protein
MTYAGLAARLGTNSGPDPFFDAPGPIQTIYGVGNQSFPMIERSTPRS